jgi:hypothetical protein
MFGNYNLWCTFLSQKSTIRYKIPWLIFLREIINLCWLFCNCRGTLGKKKSQQRNLLLISLYFLIWGEAANIRFMPECLCYIFHNVICNCSLAYKYSQPSWHHITVFHLDMHRHRDCPFSSNAVEELSTSLALRCILALNRIWFSLFVSDHG